MNIPILLLRLVVGLLFLGHGTQKLFGWFGGNGLNATGEFFEKIGFMPGKFWWIRPGNRLLDPDLGSGADLHDADGDHQGPLAKNLEY